jgi:phosphoglycolate phosphatase
MPFPLVVFDFDGTLADSLAQAIAIFRRIGPGLGLNPIADDDVPTLRTLPTKQLFKKLGVRFWRLPRVVRAYQAAAAEHAHELKLHAGIAEMLATLHAGGHRLGVLSSNREDVIRACLRANGVEEVFAFVVGYPKLFGKAKALRRIMKAEGIDRDGMLYVGDEVRDIEAANKVKVPVVAATWGFHARSLLEEAGPTSFATTPAEVLEAATA